MSKLQNLGGVALLPGDNQALPIDYAGVHKHTEKIVRNYGVSVQIVTFDMHGPRINIGDSSYILVTE